MPATKFVIFNQNICANQFDKYSTYSLSQKTKNIYLFVIQVEMCAIDRDRVHGRKMNL